MRTLLGTAILCGLVACGPAKEEKATSGGGGIFVSNYPLQYIAERIAGDTLEITFPAPPDIDPAFWTPGDEEIAAFQAADAVLLNGATYEKWRDKVSLPAKNLVVTFEATGVKPLELPTTITHSHGEAGEHSHRGIDFNTWLDPQLAKLQARAVKEALLKIAPEHAELFAANQEKLEKDLDALDEAFGELGLELDDVSEWPLFASHPVYGYLAHRHDWNLTAMLWEPDVMPHDEEWQELAHTLEYHPAKWMIYEDEPAPEIAAKLKELGVGVVVFRPCGNRPPSGDYLTEMRAGIERLKVAFQP